MSLRARLAAAFTILLVAAIAALGIVLVNSTRTVLTAQIDDQLLAIQGRNLPGGSNLPGRGPGDFDTRFGSDFGGRDLAFVLTDRNGDIVFASPSGFQDEPDPLPNISAAREASGSERSGRRSILTIPAVDGSMEYRAVARTADEGGIEVWAAPLTEVDAAVARLMGTLVVAGFVVLLLGGGLTWWMVRRSLRPVDQMVDTATAIAAGDLSSRVPDSDAGSELDRLGSALNDMLHQIESAFASERDAQERLKLFIADASHELRTPIAAMQGYAELYRKGGLGEDSALENAMRRIATESGRMERLVEDLMLLAKLDADQPLERRPVHLAGVVRDVVADSRAIDPDRRIDFHAAPDLIVTGDEARLTQVVANLLSNVRTHTPSGGAAEVRLTRDEGDVLLEVTDDGPGLASQHIGNVFDRFYRADASRSRASGGTGLGLAIVAAIVEAHGGSVAAVNAPGGGARFTVRLPEHTPNPREQPPDPDNGSELGAAGIELLADSVPSTTDRRGSRSHDHDG